MHAIFDIARSSGLPFLGVLTDKSQFEIFGSVFILS